MQDLAARLLPRRHRRAATAVIAAVIATALLALAVVAGGRSVADLGAVDHRIGSEALPVDAGSSDPPVDGGAPGAGSTTATPTGVAGPGIDEAAGAADPPDAPASGPAPVGTVPAGGVLSTDPGAVYAAGSCHIAPSADAQTIEVPCERPHTIEVYAVGSLPGDPGDPAAPFQGRTTAVELCDREFRAITGVGLGLATVLERSVLRPSEETWLAGERDVTCYVAYPEPVVGPLVGVDPVRSFGRVSIYGLRAGDCLVDFDGGATDYGLVDCAAPHDAEVFADLPIEGDAYPGEAELDRRADELCFGRPFEEFVGVAYEDSTILALRSRPTAESWALGDRTIRCILTDELVRTGSFAGSGL